MGKYFWISGEVLFGGLLGAAISSVPKKPPRWMRTFGLVCILSVCLYGPMLYGFARVSRLPFSWSSLFPDATSLVVGIYIYLLVSLAVGLFLGCIRARGIRHYLGRAAGSRLHKGMFLGFLAMNLTFALLGVGASEIIEMRSATLRINEVCAHNFNLKAEPSGDCADYIELYNFGSEPVNLEGFYLSDTEDQLGKSALPKMEVPAGGCVMAWADGSSPKVLGQGEISLSFRLSDGEQVCLSRNRVGLVDSVEVPALPDNVAWTLTGGAWIGAYGTPGLPNDGVGPYMPPTLEEPQFSLPGGFYDEPVQVGITAQKGCTVYYTLDGSVPDENACRYNGPITLEDISGQPDRYVSIKNTTLLRNGSSLQDEPVDKGTVLRAIAIDSEGAFSPVTSAAYFVGDFSTYQGRAVLSIVADPEDLFGDNGICVTGAEYDAWEEGGGEGESPTPNFKQRGKAWERPASVQLWDETGALLLEDDCGIRLQGNDSRGYRRKRFSFFAREFYGGSDTFSAELFGDRELHSFFLRNDVYDFMAQALLEGRELGFLRTIPVTVFLDGEFYYTAYMRERYEESYFSTHFAVDPDDVVFISAGGTVEMGQDKDARLYQEFLSYVQEHDASDPAVYVEIQRQMDVQSYIDFVCANLYCNNLDWSLNKNYMLWRTRTQGGEGYADGRWRWLAYDMDAVGWSGEYLGTDLASIDIFHCKPPNVGLSYSYIEMPVFSNLLQNPDFRRDFVLSYLDMMNVNFNLEHAMPLLEEYGLAENKMWTTFLRERPSYAVEYLIDALELAGTPCTVTLEVSEPEGGRIAINTTRADTETGSWTGTYVTGFPVALRAEPAPGWEFVGWQGSVASGEEQLTVPLTGDTALTAVFAPVGKGG